MSINQKAIILLSIVIIIIAIIPQSIALFIIIMAFFFLSPFSNTLIKKLDKKILKPSQLINRAEKKQYLQSIKWQEKREARLIYDNYTCCNCGATTSLEVHHSSYYNLYKEEITDLETLCRTCHQNKHDNYGYSYDTIYPKSNELDI